MPDSTQLEEKFVWPNTLAYFVGEVNSIERVMQHYFITNAMAK
jgi:hypothetical protein